MAQVAFGEIVRSYWMKLLDYWLLEEEKNP